MNSRRGLGRRELVPCVHFYYLIASVITHSKHFSQENSFFFTIAVWQPKEKTGSVRACLLKILWKIHLLHNLLRSIKPPLPAIISIFSKIRSIISHRFTIIILLITIIDVVDSTMSWAIDGFLCTQINGVCN